MEASALPASVGLARARVGLGVSLLRLRSDEQLVSLFRAGNEDAFRVIHDRYRGRMHAYARQMLSSAACDPEDVVQEIFVRAYAGLRANRRDLALRAWLYRIAHNRCIDEIRRPQAIAVETVDELGESCHADPHLRAEQREALRRLIADVQRLPEQQRSALLMRELGGMPYADLSGALGVSVPAVKSLLVRARVGLVQASEARDTDCAAIREDLIVAHDRGVRASGRARRHMRDCSQCRQFRREVHGSSRRFALLLPTLGPVAAVAKLLGIGTLGGGGAAAGSSTGAAAGSTAAAAGSSGAAAGGGAAVAGGGAAVSGGGAVVASGTVVAGGGAIAGGAVAAGGGAVAGGALAAAGAGHVATILAATVVAAGSAIGIQQAASAPHHHGAPRSASAGAAHRTGAAASGAAARSKTLAAVPHGAGGLSARTSGAARRVTTAGSGGGARDGSRHDGGTVSLRSSGTGYAAGAGSTSTIAGAGSGTTTSTTSTGTATTTTTTGTATTDSPATTTTPGSGVPTSTATTTDPTGSAAPTTTTPITGAPTSTSAATTAAHSGRSGGGSTVLPRIKPIRSGGGSLRNDHRLVRAVLFTR